MSKTRYASVKYPVTRSNASGSTPEQQLSLQKHRQRAEHWVVVQGTARITVGERVVDLVTGQHVDIAIGEVHRLANLTEHPVEIVEVQFGSYLGEDDIVRLQDDYGRAGGAVPWARSDDLPGTSVTTRCKFCSVKI